MVVDAVLTEVVVATATVSVTFAVVVVVVVVVEGEKVVSSDLDDCCSCGFTGDMFLLIFPPELTNAIALAKGTFALVLAMGLVTDAAVAVSKGLTSPIPSPLIIPFSKAPARSDTRLPFRPLIPLGEPSFNNFAFLRSAAAAARLVRSSLTRSLYISS